MVWLCPACLFCIGLEDDERSFCLSATADIHHKRSLEVSSSISATTCKSPFSGHRETYQSFREKHNNRTKRGRVRVRVCRTNWSSLLCCTMSLYTPACSLSTNNWVSFCEWFGKVNRILALLWLDHPLSSIFYYILIRKASILVYSAHSLKKIRDIFINVWSTNE